MSIQALLDLAEAQGIDVSLNEYGQLQIDASKSGLSPDDAYIWTAQIYRFYAELSACLRDTDRLGAMNANARQETATWLIYIADQAKANPILRKE